MHIVDALRSGQTVTAAELRPPRAELAAVEGMDAWIDTYHAVRGLTRGGTYVFLTDNAVGAREEDNLRHLTLNLGPDAPRERVVPFLTCKHPLDHCLAYASRAWQHGFPALVVLGGDRRVGAPRCVEHAWQLRELIRRREPDLLLGGWANPHADAAAQVGHLLDPRVTAEFFLTQVVSHHDLPLVDHFLNEVHRRALPLPGVFGVFYYRSANPATLSMLQSYMPTPAAALAREFAAGASAQEICARTLRALIDRGVRHFYISNLPIGRARTMIAAVLETVGAAAGADADRR